MHSEFSTAGHWNGAFDEGALRDWVVALRATLPAPRVSLGLVFLSPRLFPHARRILEVVQEHAQVPLLTGCSSPGLIAGDAEIEEEAGLALGLYALPGARLRAVRFRQEQVEESSGPGYWQYENDVAPEATHGWLCFADPFRLDCEAWLRGWNEAYAPRPIVGGLAASALPDQTTQVYLDGQVFEDGGIGISFGGEVSLESVIAQGCTPIGETWTITRAEGNLVHEIGNRPAYAVLAETVNRLPPEARRQIRGNLLVGLVVNEYLEEFHRGDFLVRNLIGADPVSGILAVGAQPRVGQTLQFQQRAASAATEDMVELLERARRRLKGRTVYGACLCSCSGRGRRLFGQSHHDVRHVQRYFGPLGVAGFFCNGEIGPVGDKNFLHGYTASLALFTQRAPAVPGRAPS